MNLKEIQDERRQLIDEFLEIENSYQKRPDIIDRLKQLEDMEVKIHRKQDGWWLTNY